MFHCFRVFSVGWLLIGCLLAGCGTTQPEDSLQAVKTRGVLRVGTTGDYKPMSFREPATGKYRGFDADLAEELARDLGVKIEYVHTTWPTLMRDTLDRKFDLALCGITVTPERKKRALMSDGYLANGKTVLCRAEDAGKYLSLAAIDHPEVRVMENPGGLNERFAREHLPHATLIIHPVNEEIPELVASGKADVMITETVEAAYYRSLDRRLAAPLLDAPFTRGEMGALLPPGSEALRDYVNGFIDSARWRNDLFFVLSERHLGVKRPEPDDNITVLRLKGSWFEMGRQYGAALREPMRRVLEFADRRASEGTDRYMLPGGLPCGVDFIDRFFEGVAAGSGLSKAELVRINGVEVAYTGELRRFLGREAEGKCSGLALFGAKSRGGVMFYGRNYDWLPAFSELGLVLTFLQPEGSEMSFAMLNYPGCVYLTTGMNSAGLFVEINSGSAASKAGDRKAIQNTWLLWQVLTEAETVDRATEMLNALPARSAYIVGLADPAKCASFEWCCRGSYVVTAPDSAGVLAMTNHFVRPGWRNRPHAYGSPIASASRRQALLNLAEKVAPGSADEETVKMIISVPTDAGGAMWKGTIFQVVAVPKRREFHIRRRGGDWQRFAF
jgi:cyclohexadienyl dehydratase